MILAEPSVRKRMYTHPKGRSPGKECIPADMMEITRLSTW